MEAKAFSDLTFKRVFSQAAGLRSVPTDSAFGFYLFLSFRGLTPKERVWAISIARL